METEKEDEKKVEENPLGKNCDNCGFNLSDLDYANGGGNCGTCQPSLL